MTLQICAHMSPYQSFRIDDTRRRPSVEEKRGTLPGLDFLFTILYLASVGFLVRNKTGAFRKPKWYVAYSLFSIVHSMIAFYGMYRFAIYTRKTQESPQDAVTIKLVFICILSQFTNAVLSKLCTFVTNESRKSYYTEMEAAYVDICNNNPSTSLRIYFHVITGVILHSAVFGLALSFTFMDEFLALYEPYTQWCPWAPQILKIIAVYSAFSMCTVANATPLVLTHSACTLTEINRALNEKLKKVTSARHIKWWQTKDPDILLDQYRRLFRLYRDLKHLLSFRVFTQFSVTTLNLVITSYLQYTDTNWLSDTKIRIIGGNMFFFILLFWSAYQVHRMKVQSEQPVQLLSSTKYYPGDPQRTEELRMFITMWQSQDVRISGSGFFNVDLSLIVSIISTVVTYTVILVQVKTHQPFPCYAASNVTGCMAPPV